MRKWVVNNLDNDPVKYFEKFMIVCMIVYNQKLYLMLF